MEKAAIVLMGLPGVGKGTQAFKLINRFPNFTHLDTGQEIKRRVDDPAFAHDPKVGRQRQVYYRGDPNDTVWVTGLISERIRSSAAEGKGVVLSGSPRKIYEAKRLGPLLKEIYRTQVLVIKLKALEETVRERMLRRLVCDNPLCAFPAVRGKAPPLCPQCGEGKFSPKKLDSEEGISHRIGWYHSETVPGLEYLRALGPSVATLNAQDGEEEVFLRVVELAEER